MKRGSRLLVPLLLAAIMGVLFWAIEHDHGLIARAGLKPEQTSTVQEVVKFLIFIPLVFFVVRGIDLLAFDMFTQRRNVRAPQLLREIVSLVLFVILFSWAFSYTFHSNITAVLATGTVVAAVLGLALQDTLGNLFSGIALALEDSFEIGDVVRTGDQMGVVEAVRWRGTRIRTFANTIVIVPNSMLARDRLEVFPRNNLNARTLQINIDYNVPPATAISVLGQAAANVDGVSSVVPAYARVASFADSSVVYDIKYHTVDYSQRDRIDADIRKAVWYSLRRNDMPIPYPIRTHARYEPPAHKHQPEASEIASRLAHIDVLAPLPSTAHDTIASATRLHTFAKGETIIRQGAPGSSMFVVHDGTVSVRVGDDEVARLGAGDFFGEMALLTGENRTASVVALGEVVIIEITKEALQPVLRDHPEFAAAISKEVAERRGGLESLRMASNEEAQQTVLSRIRAFFAL